MVEVTERTARVERRNYWANLSYRVSKLPNDLSHRPSKLLNQPFERRNYWANPFYQALKLLNELFVSNVEINEVDPQTELRNYWTNPWYRASKLLTDCSYRASNFLTSPSRRIYRKNPSLIPILWWRATKSRKVREPFEMTEQTRSSDRHSRKYTSPKRIGRSFLARLFAKIFLQLCTYICVSSVIGVCVCVQGCFWSKQHVNHQDRLKTRTVATGAMSAAKPRCVWVQGTLTVFFLRINGPKEPSPFSLLPDNQITPPPSSSLPAIRLFVGASICLNVITCVLRVFNCVWNVVYLCVQDETCVWLCSLVRPSHMPLRSVR